MLLDKITLKGPLGLSLIAMAIGAVALLAQAPALFSAAFSRGVGENRTLAALDEHVQKHEKLAELSQKRFDGRSLFFPPPPPPPKVQPKPVVEEKPKVEEKPAEPMKPAPPASYGGPKIAYVIGDRVYFKEGKEDDKLTYLQVGESNSDVKVVGISPPWSVRLQWKEAEFDVVPIDWMNREYAFFSSTTPTFTAPPGLVMSSSKPAGSAAQGGGRGSEGSGGKAAIASARERQAAARAEAESRARAAEEEEQAQQAEEQPEEDPQDPQETEEGEEEDEAEDEDDGEPQGRR